MLPIVPLCRQLLLASVAISLAGCAGRPATAPPSSFPVSAAPAADGLPLPPLDPGHRAPPRTTSAGDLPFDANNVTDFSANGQTGDKGDGTFAVLPGGEDDILSAWAIFKVQLAADDRPVTLDLNSTFAALPGGEDDLILSYWLGAFSFSQTRWDWLDPPAGSGDPVRPGAWNAAGTVVVPLNAADLRQRYCNLGGEVYLCVLVEPKLRAGAWCGVTIEPSTLVAVGKNAAGYFRTEPLPSTIAAAAGDAGSGTITLDVPQGEADEADRTYIERRETGATSAAQRAASAAGGAWQPLGFLPKGAVRYVDPADNAEPQLTMPKPGKTYEYRATAAVLEGNRRWRARASNHMQGKLQGWDSFTIGAQVQSFDPCLVKVNGNPAVTYANNNGALSQLLYARATTADGRQQADWPGAITLHVPTGGGTDMQPSLATIAGFPAVAYRDPDSGEVRYRRATVNTGMSPWSTTSVISDISEDGFNPSLAEVNAAPAIAYFESGFGCLFYARANTADGDAQNDWPPAAILTGGGQFPSIAEVNGHPAIACKGGNSGASLMYGIAATDGSTAGDWNFLELDDLFNAGTTNTLLVVNGSPAISHYAADTGAVDFYRANNADGSNFSDWTTRVAVALTADIFDTSGGNLTVVDGRPVVAFILNGKLELARSSTAQGGQFADWDTEVTEFSPAGRVSIAEIDGRLAVTWVDDASGTLFYAIEQ
jgi:hypothetical protein